MYKLNRAACDHVMTRFQNDKVATLSIIDKCRMFHSKNNLVTNARN